MKLSPISEVVKGKKIIVIDDSIVRGTTSRQIIRMLKETGAKEVHMRISSPPTTHPCYYGVDTPDQNQLIASNYTISEIANFIEADSLAYLSNDGLLNSVGRDLNYCKTCFDGNFIIKPETKIQKK
jgi:amidophosphoribosyltransferase